MIHEQSDGNKPNRAARIIRTQMKSRAAVAAQDIVNDGELARHCGKRPAQPGSEDA